MSARHLNAPVLTSYTASSVPTFIGHAGAVTYKVGIG